MARVVENRDGKKVTLLNPHEKGKKYAEEIKNGIRVTNDGEIKRNENGIPMELTKEGKAYRAGYLDARKDAANAYKASKKEGK